MSEYIDKKLSILSRGSTNEDFSKERQSLLLRDLEFLLDLNPSTLRSNLLALPKELREQIFSHALPLLPVPGFRPELHTCLWGADMVHEPWRHDIFGYADSVPLQSRLHPSLLLINRQLHDEVLDVFFQKAKLTLHAELRNSRTRNLHFNYSPQVLQLPMLQHVTDVRLYVEWNYQLGTKSERMRDQVHMTNGIVAAMDKLLASLQSIETIELSILFFWKLQRTGKYYQLSMQDLFELEDVFKAHGEERWLQMILRENKDTAASPNLCAGVGYKLLTEDKGTDQSGAMEIFVSQNLEDAVMQRRRSNVDFYGNYGISDPLPQPSYRLGAMI